MAATSMMKEYVKRQLKYWLDNFKDDQLPRDFNSKGFARPQLTLHKITLKPDKIAALLCVSAPLIVTRATCSELTIKVPSWQTAEKFVQEPLSLRLGDLFVDVKHIDECDEHVRRDSVARARAASMEPDPLGSIASMYQFATIINERLEVQVENVSLKLYERHALRVRVEMAHFHARTTNAMWQDMRDLTDCVDRSPDGLLKTRFKFISAQCSVYLHDDGDASDVTPPPLRLLRDHAIAMRMTLFGHRKSKQDTWEVLSRVVDLNLETLPFEMDTAQVRQVAVLYTTLARWAKEAATMGTCSKAEDGSGLLPHQMDRGPLTPKKTKTVDSEASAHEHNDDSTTASPTSGENNTFALQITVRFTAHVLLRVRSERRGDFQLAVIAQHAALNWIQHDDRDASTELQLTVHDVSVRHKEKVLFHVKPAREVLQLKRLPGPSNSVFIKWHLQKLECHLEKELAVLANELFHSFNEIEQAATITCGTCHHKIQLDAIETHVCGPSGSLAGSPRAGSANGSRQSSAGLTTPKPDASTLLVDSTQIPKLRLVFALDELEIVTDSFLFRSVQDLARLASEPVASSPAGPTRRFVATVKDLSVSTESKEFVGDAIFVPVLPLAFQMLECTIRGCGCVYRQQQRQKQRRAAGSGPTKEPDAAVDECKLQLGSRALPRWPDRVFAELGQLALRSTNTVTTAETFVSADGMSLRLSFSDGVRVCPLSTPQMSCFFHVERIRCQMEHTAYQHVRNALLQLQDPLKGHAMTALTLFFAVVEIRNVELTLLEDESAGGRDSKAVPRLKAQLRHVGGVADNHQGRLSLQTNVDFRALLQSESVTFDFGTGVERDTSATETNGHSRHVTKRERRRQREEALHNQAADRIQCVFRGFVARRRRRVDQELRRLTREDEAEKEALTDTLRDLQIHRDEQLGSDASVSASSPRGKSLFVSAEELAAINPMKMVAAAGVLKDGVMGFVKAKQQRLESEMTELAMQSKESASKFIPKYSAMKNLLSPKTSSGSTTTPVASTEVDVTSKAQETRGVEPGKDEQLHEAQSTSEIGRELQEEAQSRASSDHSGSAHSEAHDEQDEMHAREEGDDDQAGADQNEDAEEDNEEEAEEEDEVLPSDDEEPPTHEEKILPEVHDPPPPPLSATETLLVSLPPIVRLMVQVEEHRLCVPIDPRVQVAVLCREIVRRFNEMFAQHGVIAHVTLQNPQGGVFAASDIVGLVCDTTATKREVIFAYPHSEDGGVKSVVHIDPSTYDQPSPAKDVGAKVSSVKRKAGASKFARCSKLPLPLVVALLANESERDLLREILKDGATNGEDWPELALNTSFLDPTRDMLQVEVRWPGGSTTHSVEVTNRDAFLLCLQQLGLCTSRENSKHVGKVLRDRLKMDLKNPLIRAACEASPEFQTDLSTEGARTNGASYESLKEIVQEDFGVYVRIKE